MAESEDGLWEIWPLIYGPIAFHFICVAFFLCVVAVAVLQCKKVNGYNMLETFQNMYTCTKAYKLNKNKTITKHFTRSVEYMSWIVIYLSFLMLCYA